MRTLLWVHVLLVLVVFPGCNDKTGAADARPAPDAPASHDVGAPDAPVSPDAAAPGPVLTVLVDNYTANASLKSGWGYACLVTGLKQTVLFDTGMDSTTLLDNMTALSLAPQEVDDVVLSHDHLDHTAGLSAFLEKSPQSRVYLLAAFSAETKQVAQKGAKVIEVADANPVKIAEGVYSLGALPGTYMGTPTPEQSLAVETPQGVVVITGCAHSAIVKIVQHAKQVLQQEILLVMGGFHLLTATPAEITSIADSLQQLGVKYVGASHCTGDAALAGLKQKFGAKFLQIGVGSVVKTGDLKP